MATHVFESHPTECPYQRAREYLHESLEAVVKSHQITSLALTAGALEKPVLVSYKHGEDPMRFDEPWLVHWTPEGGGPYPDFDGELTVRADDSYRRSILELRGDYVPPLGAVGKAFDFAVGSRIAAATARALLQQIAQHMEARYNDEEEAKHIGERP
jgi:hypothetical protein